MKDCMLPKIKQNPNRRRNLPKSVVSRPFLMKGPRLPFHEPDHKIFIAWVGMSSQCKQQVSKTPSLGGDASKESEKKKRNVSGVCSFHLFSYNHQKAHPKKDTHKTIGKFGDLSLPPHDGAEVTWNVAHCSLQKLFEKVLYSRKLRPSGSTMSRRGSEF